MDSPTPVGQGTTPTAGLAVTTVLSMITLATQAVCLSQRVRQVRNWRGLALTHWLIMFIYFDSGLYILASALLSHGFGLSSSQQTCTAAAILCIICYLSTKLIYLFLVEKVYIVTGIEKPRLESKLYCFNCFGMLVPYAILAVVNVMFRIDRFDDNGTCIIGTERKTMVPFVVFDVVINIYLTGLFIMPLRKLYSFKNNPNSPLRTMTIRTFIGSCCTLTSTIVNLTVVAVLNGEPAWICLMICNFDILFSVLVLHWVTDRDAATSNTESATNRSVPSGAVVSDYHRQKLSLHSMNDESRVINTLPIDEVESAGAGTVAAATIDEKDFSLNSRPITTKLSWNDEDEDI